MGRGRAKAKQQKVARRLKYNSGGTDLDRLKQELGVAEDAQDEYGTSDDTDEPTEYYADYLDDEKEQSNGSGRH